MEPQRIALVGPGAVGSFFAAHLSAIGHDILVCARRGFSEFVIESPEAPMRQPARVVTGPGEITDGPYPWVLVAVKAHQTSSSAAFLDALCDSDTVVVALQNGVEAVERLEPYVNGATVLPAVVYCGGRVVEPGHIQHTGMSRLILPDTTEAHAVVDLFEGTPAQVEASPHHLRSAWFKLSINNVANGLTALTGQPQRVLGLPSLRPTAIALLREAMEIGCAVGADLDLDAVEGIIDGIAAGGDNPTSMLTDTLDGRPTEHDAIQGAVVRAARSVGMESPITDTVLAILSARSESLAEAE